MNKRTLSFSLFGIALFTLFTLTGCGTGVSAGKGNVSGGNGASAGESEGGGGNTGGGGAPVDPNSVSCQLVAAVPTYSSVRLTLTVLGPVTQMILNGVAITAALDPVTRSLVINYPIPAPGPYTISATVSNPAKTGTCFAAFTSPTLEQARGVSVPADNNLFDFHKDAILTDTNGRKFRYRISINKVDGLAYWNSISLDSDVLPGVVDAWVGWTVIPTQFGKTDQDIALNRVEIFAGAFNVNIFSDFFNFRYDLPIHCGGGTCARNWF